ncbi:hypothetical protein HHK36_022401 [Tetracentron sinense]|uniref:Uncharacterized protein n=1 Tax=Tetracentron sinense TaxID=13715 RepID=A0A834YPS6_TETSI|nr:hypothetical protein HHK36_022401 [Tetracentron sinense]
MLLPSMLLHLLPPPTGLCESDLPYEQFATSPPSFGSSTIKSVHWQRYVLPILEFRHCLLLCLSTGIATPDLRSAKGVSGLTRQMKIVVYSDVATNDSEDTNDMYDGDKVFEICLADIQNDEDQSYRKIRLRGEVQRMYKGGIEDTNDMYNGDKGFQICLADIQNDEDQSYRKIRLRAETLIGAHVDIQQIRCKMRKIMVNQTTSCDLKELVQKFVLEVIGKGIEKATSSIYPLENVFIRKVKS